MKGEEFMDVYGDTELRQYIVDQAKRHSRYKENQEDFVQEAWLRISMGERDGTEEYYKCVALRAIQAAYQKMRRKSTYNLSDIECMDHQIYRAWQMGYFRKW